MLASEWAHFPSLLIMLSGLNPAVPAGAFLAGSTLGPQFFECFKDAVTISVGLAFLVGIMITVNAFQSPDSQEKMMRQNQIMKMNFFALCIFIIVACIFAVYSAANQFHATAGGIVYPVFGIGKATEEKWTDAQSITLSCNIMFTGKGGPQYYLPGYILHFRDGTHIDLWFGSSIGATMTGDNSALYSFPAHYPHIARLLPAHLPINLDVGVDLCAKAMENLHDPAITAALASLRP